jgi:hypothetical protein
MANGGGIGTGLAEGLEAAQQLQLGKLAEQQRSIQVQQSQLQLDALKRMMNFTGSKQFQQELASPSGADEALAQLEAVQFSSGMTQAGAATARARYEQNMAQSYQQGERAMANMRTSQAIQNILAGVDPNNPATLQAAKLQIQWLLPKDTVPQMRQYFQKLTMPQLPQSLQMAKIFEEKMRAVADGARAQADAGRANLEKAEAQNAESQSQLAQARKAHLAKEGGTAQAAQYKQIEDEVASRLQAEHPIPPMGEGDKEQDPAARRANFKARYQSVAAQIADMAQEYMQQNMGRTAAIHRAYTMAKAEGLLKVFDAMGSPSKSTPTKTLSYDPSTGKIQ